MGRSREGGMARQYRVRGPRQFLTAAVVLLLLSLWFIADGWFPRESVRAAHPDPSDHFYLFNKCTGVLLLLGAVVCGVLHWMVG